jgi:hypothetical protein
VIAVVVVVLLVAAVGYWYAYARAPSGSKYRAVSVQEAAAASPPPEPDAFGAAVMHQVAGGYEATPINDGANMWANTLPVDGGDDDELLA